MEGIVRPPICFKETVVPLLLYLLFEYRNSALLKGVISMNSVGRLAYFLFHILPLTFAKHSAKSLLGERAV
jgi:hypothetical protein